MRKLAGWMLMCGVVLAAAPHAVAGEHEDALAIVEQAIKAHGGADALTKTQTLVRSSVGTLTRFDKTMPFTDEVSWSLPDRWRLSIELDKKFRQTIVVNGAKGWQSLGGPAMDLGAERLQELHNEMYVLWLTTLLPLKKEESKLSPLPDTKVNGEPAVGVKVVSKGKPEVNLYFDKKTHLLVKTARSAKEQGLTVDKEDIYSDYKDFDGVQMPTKQVEFLKGRKFIEVTSAMYKFPKKLDESVFAKP